MDSTDKLILDIIAKRKKKKKRTIIIVISIFVAFVIIAQFIPENQKRKDEEYTQGVTSKIKDYEIEARLKAEDIAKTHAVNPDEAEFSNQQVELHGNTYHCTGVITSKNDFGVKKQAKYLVKLLHNADNKNKEWELVDEVAFQ